MLENDKYDQLKTMYGVFCRVPATTQHIINAMQPYILQEGEKIVKKKENLDDPLLFVEALLGVSRVCPGWFCPRDRPSFLTSASDPLGMFVGSWPSVRLSWPRFLNARSS